MTDEEFNNNFFDVDKHAPQKGQVLIKHVTYAELVDGWLKKQLISLLLNNNKGAELSVRVLKKLAHAPEKEALRLTKAMAIDLLANKTEEEVELTPYEYLYERFYWANEDAVPVNDPHWQPLRTFDFTKHLPVEH